jgi:hypothetical protein
MCSNSRRRRNVHFAGLVSLVMLGSCSSASAQFLGYDSPQSVQQRLATNVNCTGSPQNFPVQNLGQTQHYAYFTSGVVAPLLLRAQLQGLDRQGNVTVISDTLQGVTGGAPGSAILVGLGFFPQVQVQVVCTNVAPFSLTYMGTSSTAFVPLGSQISTEVDKVITNNRAQSADFDSAVFIAPFGNSSGALFFENLVANATAGATISMQCGGSTILSSLPGGSIQTFTFPVDVGTQPQIFQIPASPCPYWKIHYAHVGSSASGWASEVLFNAPGNTTSTNISGAASDPCVSSSTTKLSVPINITTATTTQLVPLAAGQAIYVCGVSATIAPSATTADTFLLEYGTGSNCGTGTTVLSGPFGAGDVNTAQPPILITFGDPGTTTTAPASNALCLLSAGATVNIQGVLSYVQIGTSTPPGTTAPIFVNGNAGGSGGLSTTTNAISTTAGNLLVVEGTCNTGSQTLTITDANTNWQQITGSPFHDTNVSMGVFVGTVIANNAAENPTITCSGGTVTSAAIVQYTNAPNYLSAVDRIAAFSNGAVASGANIVTGTTPVTTQANEVLLGIFGLLSSSSSGVGFAAGSGYTTRAQTIGGGTAQVSDIEDQTVSVTGTYQATVTWSNGSPLNSGVGVIVTIF